MKYLVKTADIVGVKLKYLNFSCVYDTKNLYHHHHHHHYYYYYYYYCYYSTTMSKH